MKPGKTISTAVLASIVAATWSLTPTASADAPGSGIAWQPWSPALFETASEEGKYVLLNLEAVWCHWCHVMDEKTYADDGVASVIGESYVAAKVDHDARPDLANRYRNFGWPATIVFAPDGTEIVKRAGYIPPQQFADLLREIVDDPTPETSSRVQSKPEFTGSVELGEDLYTELRSRHLNSFDNELGGYKAQKKTMDRDSTQYALARTADGDVTSATMARKTIDASIALIDPEWGGAYQYSTHGDWEHPHFEKIMDIQAGFLRVYVQAYLQWKEPRYLEAAQNIERYLSTFLTSSDRAYYTSQDADLVQGVDGHAFFALPAEEREKLGQPRVDKNIYPRENGWAIEAVTTLYQATGDSRYLEKAIAAAEWIIANRSLRDGGFMHGDADEGGPYLADTLNMGRAFLQLYRATGERRWLRRASDAASFIDTNFRQSQAGYLSGAVAVGPVAAVAYIDENVSVTRFFNLLAHYTGDSSYRVAAEHGMRYLATPEVATRRIEEGGILLTALEMARDPAHYTIIGAKNDATAIAMYDIARRETGWYKRIEWWDIDEGPLQNPDVRYPVFDRTTGFICTDGRCSVPAFTPDRYRSLVATLAEPPD